MHRTSHVTEVLLTPAQASQRFLTVDNEPAISVGGLAQMRYVSKTRGKLHGPPFRKIGGKVFYEVESFDAYMRGERAGEEAS